MYLFHVKYNNINSIMYIYIYLNIYFIQLLFQTYRQYKSLTFSHLFRNFYFEFVLFKGVALDSLKGEKVDEEYGMSKVSFPL